MIALTVAMAFALPTALLLAVDVRLHHKYEKTSAYNVWGYRGPVVPAKRADEYRVVFLGGSAAFGYGVDWEDSIAARLERKLQGRIVGPYRRFTVVNLAFNNEGAYSFRFTLEDYSWLKYDLVCLYEGYNDVMSRNTAVFRHDSPIFRLTGYLPLFPLVFREKAAVMLTGDVNSIYPFGGGKTMFRPSLARKTAAETLRAAADVEAALERQIDRVASEGPRQVADTASTGCSDWPEYCRSVLTAIDFALQHDRQALAITQPYELGKVGRAHREQQREMAAMIERRFGGEPRVAYVNLGPTVDLENPSLSYDHMHLTAAGNAIVADALVEPVVRMAARRAGQ